LNRATLAAFVGSLIVDYTLRARFYTLKEKQVGR